MLRSLALGMFCSCVFSFSALGQDWPEFRGPTGQGHASQTGLPTEWNQEKNVLWRTPLNGQGWSSPVVVQGRVYLTAAVPAESDGKTSYSLQALCFDSQSGKVVWQKEIFQQGADSPKIHAKNSHASPTPLVAGDKVFVHFGHQGTACLNLQGDILWKNTELAYKPVHGNGCSPILVNDLLVFSADGAQNPQVVALHTATGKVAWTYARPNDPPKKFAFCTPLFIDDGKRQQIITPGAGSVSSLDPATGKELWHANYGDGYSIIPRPVFGHGMIFVSSCYDTAEVFAIRTDGTGNVTDSHIAWQLKRGAPHTPSMLLLGKELYFVSDNGVASCVDALTGKPHWQERVGGNYSSSLIYADGKIYLQSEAGNGLVIKAGTEFEKLAENGFGERTLASYALAEKAIFIRTDKALYKVGNP